MPILNNPPKVVKILAVLIGLFLLALATKCHGAEIAFGAGKSLVRGPAPVIDLAIRTPSSIGDAYWQTGLTMIGTSSFRGEDQPNQALLYGMLVDGFGKFDIGVGAAALQNVDRYNGSHANFELKIGYRWRRFGVEYRHNSNAGTVMPNLGRDYFLASVRLQ